ncbi:AlbA family DNA-binding domain-containing protein [Haloarcula sp. CGMCC 1.6347]|uniref:AlbA family DNA-binding domain-containing protein n=1 Tax=Haloarcula sp. CGMCC 1.6347 TaxID=3111455 RepID=UPI00300EBD5F
MDKQSALDLINELDGEEYDWVDNKIDYDIGGITKYKVEFIRDIAAMANTITDKDSHYILIGIDGDGELVGIDESRIEYRGEGPRHIFSYDGASIQQTIDSNLSPSPKLAWHKFEHEAKKWGVLEITPLSDPPCVTVQDIYNGNDRVLHRGLIYLRKGSSKSIATREDIQKIIQYRISQQRQQILDGVHKAIEIGPEWIDRLSGALPEDKGIPFTTAEDPASADLELTQRLTREPASSLDEQLNEDIAQWKYRGDDFIEAKPLWQYYAEPNSLSLDKTAVTFLTNSSFKNYLLGGFWLMEVDESDWADIILSEALGHHRAEKAASLALLLDDDSAFESLMNKARTNSKYGFLSQCEGKFGNTINDRVNFLLKDGQYNLQHDTWRKEIAVKDYSPNEIRGFVPELGRNLVLIQEDLKETQRLRGRFEKFRNALWDLEVVYVGIIAGGYKQ